MFSKLKKLFQRNQKPPFDPSSLNDPVALTTEWNPLKSGGASFRTHKLVLTGPATMKFKMTAPSMLFGVIFIVMGTVIPGTFLIGMLKSDESTPIMGIIFPIVFMIVFPCIGAAILIYMGKPVVFDKTSGYFWKGKNGPNSTVNIHENDNIKKLEDIYALQIISEYCRSSGQNSSSYYSYELNLILRDGSRINAVDHGDQKKLRQDAQSLSEFLGVPVWDAS